MNIRLLFIIVIIFLISCENETARLEINPEDNINKVELNKLIESTNESLFLFGFDLRSSPQEDARQYVPFLDYLEKTTDLSFELRFTPSDNNIIDDLGRGIVKFAAIGAGSYIQARRKYDVIPLVRGINEFNKAEYRSVIAVSNDSPISTIQELSGKRLAFGSFTSTQGHIIPRIVLINYGITLEDLGYYEYLGSHFDCANAVISNQFDACGLQDTMGEGLAQEGRFRIIYRSKYYPSSGIAANKDLSPDVLIKVKRALLDFEPKGGNAANLYKWEKTEMPNGFVEAHDEDYEELRHYINEFNIFPEPEKSHKKE